MSQKSVLRYPGGKSRAAKYIYELIPSDVEELCSPFLGGGSVELYCLSKGVNVCAYDNFKPLVNFWKSINKNPDLLARMIAEYYPLSREDFKKLQSELLSIDNESTSAAILYVLNRCSFSGTILCGGMSKEHPRFNQASINRVKNFKLEGEFSVECMDFKESMQNNEDKFLYCDPPYYIDDSLYGKGQSQLKFDHTGLADVLNKRTGWVLSYNDHPWVRELYSECDIITPTWKYGMSINKNSKELLIINY